MDKDQDLEKYAKELQSQIMEQINKKYTENVIDHWQNQRNLEKMVSPDGCGTTIACGSVATELAQNKSFTQALGGVSADEVLKHLGGLLEYLSIGRTILRWSEP